MIYGGTLIIHKSQSSILLPYCTKGAIPLLQIQPECLRLRSPIQVTGLAQVDIRNGAKSEEFLWSCFRTAADGLSGVPHIGTLATFRPTGLWRISRVPPESSQNLNYRLVQVPNCENSHPVLALNSVVNKIVCDPEHRQPSAPGTNSVGDLVVPRRGFRKPSLARCSVRTVPPPLNTELRPMYSHPARSAHLKHGGIIP